MAVTALCSSPGDIGQAGDTYPAWSVQWGMDMGLWRDDALPPVLCASRSKAKEFIIASSLAVHLFICSKVPGLENV